MPVTSSGKSAFLIISQVTNPRLTNKQMDEFNIQVGEIVSTHDESLNQQCTYIHCLLKIREEQLNTALQSLAQTYWPQDNLHYSLAIISSCKKTSTLIEYHPGFRMLMDHETSGNANFHRWTDETLYTNWKYGYNFLKSKVIPKKTDKNSGIYVLRLDNRPTPFFYVGKATNITTRIQQHTDGTGAVCIAGEPFTRVEPTTKGSVDDMESWERNEVLARMYEFGINNVRGWMYTLKTMPIEQKLSAFDQICEKFDRCRKCGRGSHFVRDCAAMSTDLWTCGMELRHTYRQQDGEAERQALADAQRRIAEAARVLSGANIFIQDKRAN